MSSDVAIRVATYNVHSCVGIDRRCDPARIAKVISDMDADVVALQEVNSRPARWSGGAALAYIARETGMTAIDGPVLHSDRGKFGNALLTRLPADDLRRIDLSIAGREPRGAIEADVHTANGPVRVIATHLGLSRPERRRQRAWIREELERAEREHEPLILLADLNEWIPFASHRRPHLPFETALGARTFPSHLPIFALDRILIDPAPAEATAHAHRTPPARAASDHLPLVADVRWSGRGRDGG